MLHTTILYEAWLTVRRPKYEEEPNEIYRRLNKVSISSSASYLKVDGTEQNKVKNDTVLELLVSWTR